MQTFEAYVNTRDMWILENRSNSNSASGNASKTNINEAYRNLFLIDMEHGIRKFFNFLRDYSTARSA
jgi:hypothetical protein